MGSIPGRGTKILHNVQCGKKNPKKTTAWFFHVGVDIDGCNETSLISHLLSDSMYYFRCALSLFFLIQRVILRHNILSFYYIL